MAHYKPSYLDSTLFTILLRISLSNIPFICHRLVQIQNLKHQFQISKGKKL